MHTSNIIKSLHFIDLKNLTILTVIAVSDFGEIKSLRFNGHVPGEPGLAGVY